MRSNLQLLIPAAGKGSRFVEAGELTPKPLIPIWDIPMLIWVILNFPLAPDDEIKILVQKSQSVKHVLAPFIDRIVNKITIIEIDFWSDGPAHSLEILMEGVASDSSVICANSDQFIFDGLESFVDAVRSGTSAGQVLTMEASSNAWSYIGRDNNGAVERIVEKEEISNEATVGVYGWKSAAILSSSLSWQKGKNLRVNGEFYVAPSYGYLIEKALPISTHTVGVHGIGVHGLGIPSDLAHFKTLKRSRDFHSLFLRQILK